MSGIFGCGGWCKTSGAYLDFLPSFCCVSRLSEKRVKSLVYLQYAEKGGVD